MPRIGNFQRAGVITVILDKDSQMPLNNPRFNTVPPSIQLYTAAERLSRLQVDLVSEAVRRAVDDVGAAIAHQLSEPLTALLLYLHEIKRGGECFEGAAVVTLPDSRIVDNALREGERVCAIMERLGRSIDTPPMDAEAAVTRGREAIEAWTLRRHVADTGGATRTQSDSNHPLLTPREHEVLALITGGASNKEGGHRLGISTRTFEVHRAHLMGKLGARNAADLVRIVLSSGH
jgi:DNA-binding CsgD family transcriptional regulator